MDEYIDTDIHGVKAFYNAKIKKDGDHAFYNPGELEFYLKYVVHQDDYILDAGCGAGHLLEAIHTFRTNRYIGIDVSIEALKLAKCKKISCYLMAIEDMSFPDKQFDLVFCLGTLEHVKDMHKAFTELVRVCSRELIISVPIWQDGIDEGYKNEKMKNIERWHTKEKWLNFFNGYKL